MYDVKGIKMSNGGIEAKINGVEVAAHIKALPPPLGHIIISPPRPPSAAWQELLGQGWGWRFELSTISRCCGLICHSKVKKSGQTQASRASLRQVKKTQTQAINTLNAPSV